MGYGEQLYVYSSPLVLISQVLKLGLKTIKYMDKSSFLLIEYEKLYSKVADVKLLIVWIMKCNFTTMFQSSVFMHITR